MACPATHPRRPSTLQRTATHEAGHAVAHLRLHVPFSEVNVRPDPRTGARGHLVYSWPAGLDLEAPPTARSLDLVERLAVCAWAGTVAEQLVYGTVSTSGMTCDLMDAHELVRHLGVCYAQRRGVLEVLRLKARLLLGQDHNRRALQVIAEALVLERTLPARSVRALSAAQDGRRAVHHA